MWIYEIYINKVSIHNKFMNQKFQNLEPSEYIIRRRPEASSGKGTVRGGRWRGGQLAPGAPASTIGGRKKPGPGHP